jgi:glutaredoxin
MNQTQIRNRSFETKPEPTRWLIGLICTGCMAMLLSPVHAQTVYRSIGADGHITFSDKPPTASAKMTPVETGAKDAGTGGATLPFELSQLANKYPVTLFTSKDCAPCDMGRQLLRTRGVPFTEKTVTTTEDSEAFQRLSGGSSLPLLSLGSQQIKGFSDFEWNQYLNAAGYPEKNQLPARYVHSAPAPLVAVQAPAAAKAANAAIENTPQPAPIAPVLPAAIVPNPAGIQF